MPIGSIRPCKVARAGSVAGRTRRGAIDAGVRGRGNKILEQKPERRAWPTPDLLKANRYSNYLFGQAGGGLGR